jgi:hypothetical protein
MICRFWNLQHFAISIRNSDREHARIASAIKQEYTAGIPHPHPDNGVKTKNPRHQVKLSRGFLLLRIHDQQSGYRGSSAGQPGVGSGVLVGGTVGVRDGVGDTNGVGVGVNDGVGDGSMVGPGSTSGMLSETLAGLA